MYDLSFHAYLRPQQAKVNKIFYKPQHVICVPTIIIMQIIKGLSLLAAKHGSKAQGKEAKTTVREQVWTTELKASNTCNLLLHATEATNNCRGY